MKPHLICIAIIFSTVIYAVSAVPQRNKKQDSSTIDDEISFDEPSTGFTEPNHQPSTGPTKHSFNGQNCTCVPYHRCVPSSDNIKSYNVSPVDEDIEVTGFGSLDIASRNGGCDDYLDVCCVENAKTMKSITVKPNAGPTFEAGCGVRNVNGLDFEMTGAENHEAGFGEFPWTVAVINIEDDALICVGSLIHPRAVLTGNHCVRNYEYRAKDLKIRAGEWDTQTTKERLPYQEIAVSRIFSHPNYNERSLANNFAVVELENPFQLGPHINTVCLPKYGFVSDQNDCFTSGWGKDEFGKDGKYSVILKKTQMEIIDFNTCRTKLQDSRLGSKFHLDQSFICAGPIEGDDTCRRDGGAPLVCPIGKPSENRYVQSGITSWGLGCTNQTPSVFANVASARDWIDQQVRFIGLDTNYYTYTG